MTRQLIKIVGGQCGGWITATLTWRETIESTDVRQARDGSLLLSHVPTFRDVEERVDNVTAEQLDEWRTIARPI